MTTPQHPIGSGFDRHSTSDDVLAGIDLHGTTALVTGGYSGLGLETTRALTGAGARVIVPARRVDVARSALRGLDDVMVADVDLADLERVRTFAADLVADGTPLGLLINAAGIMAAPETRIGPGWESHFAVNHLAHQVLTLGVWPLLAEHGARVVVYSSAAHHLSAIRWDDLQFATGYDRWLAYGQSKTANALFAVQLDAIGHSDGIRAFSLHPGGIATPLQRHIPLAEQIELGWRNNDGEPVDASFKSVAQGAATGLWAATSTQLDGLGGVYCEDCEIAAPAQPGATMNDGGVRTHATDPDQAARLWDMTTTLLN